MQVGGLPPAQPVQPAKPTQLETLGTFGSLPRNLVKGIFSYLDLPLLGRVARLSTPFLKLSEDVQKPVWEELCKKCKLRKRPDFKLNFFSALGQEQPLALLEWSNFWSEGKHIRENEQKSFNSLSRLLYKSGYHPTRNRNPRTPEVSRALLYQAILRQKWQDSPLIPMSDHQAANCLQDAYMAPVTLVEDKYRAALYQALFRFEERTQFITDPQAVTLLEWVIKSPLTGLGKERALAARLVAEMRLNNRTNAITQEKACQLLIQVASDPQADPTERSRAVIFLAKFLLNNGIHFDIDDKVSRLLNQVSLHLPISDADRVLQNTALLLLAKMRYTKRTDFITDDQAVEKLKQIIKSMDSEDIASKHDKIFHTYVDFVDWAEATSYFAMFLLDNRTNGITDGEVFENLTKVIDIEISKVFNTEDHITIEKMCEIAILQARMRISKRTNVISDEQAFNILVGVAGKPGARPDQVVRATLFQAIMRCEELTENISKEDASQKLRSVMENANASPEDKILAEQYFDRMLEPSVKRRKEQDF